MHIYYFSMSNTSDVTVQSISNFLEKFKTPNLETIKIGIYLDLKSKFMRKKST